MISGDEIMRDISAPMVHNYTRYSYTESLKNAEDNGDERSISAQKTGNYEDRLSVAINGLLHDDDDYQNFYSYNTSELYSGFIL